MSKFLIVEITLTMVTMRHTVPSEAANCWTEVLKGYVTIISKLIIKSFKTSYLINHGY